MKPTLYNARMVNIEGVPKFHSHKYVRGTEEELARAYNMLSDIWGIEQWWSRDGKYIIISKWCYKHYPTWGDLELYCSDAMGREIKLRYL